VKLSDPSRAAHVGFIANSRAEVDSAYAAAMAAGATDNGKPSARLYYDPRYYAGNVFDPDGCSLEFVSRAGSTLSPNRQPCISSPLWVQSRRMSAICPVCPQ
jgi:predicted lactoylglutathione lyase